MDGTHVKHPSVTVLMPVYNGHKYLREAISSILCQTFQDFELLILDDGSTDDSVPIVQSFTDPRIRLVINTVNLGVAATLNKGIELARGYYVARMDADDIALPNRLEAQCNYFSRFPETDVLAAWVSLMDSSGNVTGAWECDRRTATHEDILDTLPRHNCIAHPSVMIRRDLLASYRYRDTKIHAEDYDLWLRMAAGGMRIAKIPDVLLKYRVHPGSVTTFSNSRFYGRKNIVAKTRFLLFQFKTPVRLRVFDLRVVGSLCRDLARLGGYHLEKHGRALVRACLLATGGFYGRLVGDRYRSSLFFFFPSGQIGGAERVHADIVAAVKERSPLIVLTNAPTGCQEGASFEQNGTVLDASAFLYNPIGRMVGLGFFSAVINKKKNAMVLGANTSFYYELVPYLENHVKCYDLIHAFGGGAEVLSLPIVNRLDHRVVVNGKTLEDIKGQYADAGIDPHLIEKVSIVENAVRVPVSLTHRIRRERFKVLYVGRDSIEKRVHLVREIARYCQEKDLPFEFSVVGHLCKANLSSWPKNCKIIGEVTDFSALEKIYNEHDLLILTSSSEGFPLVIMEGMAHGVVPITTDVGGISMHVVHGETGYLVPAGQDERGIVDSFVEQLSLIAKDSSALESISETAYRHAKEHFDFERFNRSYWELFSAVQSQEPR